MKHLTGLLGLAGLLLLIGTPAPAGDKTDLRWRLKRGQVHKYLLKHVEVKTIALGTQKFETTTRMEWEWEWKVAGVDDAGVATLEHKVTALRVHIRSDSFDLEYDSSRGNRSADDTKAKLMNFYDQLRFAKYQVRLRPDGRVAEFRGLDKLVEEANPGANLLDYYGLHLRDGAFAWFLQQPLGTLPGRSAAPGAKWSAEVDTALGDRGQLTGRNEFILGNPADDGSRTLYPASWKGSQKLALDMRWANSPLRGPLKTTRLDGTFRFDSRAGAVASGTARVEMRGDLKLGDAAEPLVLKVGFRHTLELEARP